jgi:hypothetical protein
MDDFVANRLAPIYGGADNAARYLKMVRSTDRNQASLLKDLGTADEISNNRQFNVRQKRRWTNLRSELARRLSLLS